MRWLLPPGIQDELLARAARIKLAVFDVDGVLTDGRLHYGPKGEDTKVFNTLDGHGLKMLHESGVELAIISGRSSDALARRAKDLRIGQLFMGVPEKRAVFEQLLASLSLDATEAAGLGDDVVDLPFLSRCGFAACVPAAPQYMHAHVHYVTHAPGGGGAVREFCELIMHARGTLDSALNKFLE
ncbi:MAG: phenylphosphate carboxylase subunit delta [Betaproteobacteria bacterium]